MINASLQMVRQEGKNNEKTLPVVLSDSLCSMLYWYLNVLFLPVIRKD